MDTKKLQAMQKVFTFLCTGTSIALLFTGCGPTLHHVKFQAANLPAASQPVRVALVLEPQLCQYQYQYAQGNTVVFEYALGEPLCQLVRTVAAQSFQEVEVITALDTLSDGAQVDVLVLPEVLRVSQHMPFGIGRGPDETLIVFRWTLKEPKGSQTLWMKTIKGSAVAKAKTAAHRKRLSKELMERALMDLYEKTRKEIDDTANTKLLAGREAR